MQLHELKPKIKRIKTKRIGRGGKRGSYSGRGIKGQKSRAGHKIRPEIRDAIKKIPKLRGYKAKVKSKNTAIVNIGSLNKHFEAGSNVTPKELLKKGILKKIKGRVPLVKILSSGEATKKLLVSDFQISKQAKEKIEKAGGTVKL